MTYKYLFYEKIKVLKVLVWTLTTAFLGLACSCCICRSCSGVALWTRLSTLNQPLQHKHADRKH